ncbi:MAG: hypothetical protein AAGI25_14500 [Bacteroidota bacterium]
MYCPLAIPTINDRTAGYTIDPYRKNYLKEAKISPGLGEKITDHSCIYDVIWVK